MIWPIAERFRPCDGIAPTALTSSTTLLNYHLRGVEKAGNEKAKHTWISGAMAFFLLRLNATCEMIICVWRDPNDSLRLLDYSV
jgi:hypothetical protein